MKECEKIIQDAADKINELAGFEWATVIQPCVCEDKEKEEYQTIEGIVGSLIITPKELKEFKKHGIDLFVALEKNTKRNKII